MRSRIVNITEENLNLKKCYWYLIRWGRDKDGFPSLLTVDKTPTNLTLQSHEMENITEIKRLKPTDSLKTLGVMALPSGSIDAQSQQTSEQLKDIIISVKNTHLSRREASLLLPVYIHSKLRHLLASTSVTKKQWQALDRIFQSKLISVEKEENIG